MASSSSLFFVISRLEVKFGGRAEQLPAVVGTSRPRSTKSNERVDTGRKLDLP
jgi:hypothetical protein